MKNVLKSKAFLVCSLCTILILTSNLITSAAGSYYSLTPPGLGIQRNSDSKYKRFLEKGFNQCTKTQNNHVLEGWIEDQRSGADMTYVYDVKTNTNKLYNYYSLKDNVEKSTHLSVEVDSIYGYNCYGYWSPDLQ